MAHTKQGLADLAVQIALAEAAAGVVERDNDNRGERVDVYERAANGALGEAWCAVEHRHAGLATTMRTERLQRALGRHRRPVCFEAALEFRRAPW